MRDSPARFNNNQVMHRRAFRLVILMLLSVVQATPAQDTAKPSPPFSGSALPEPAQQHAVWQHPPARVPDYLLNDIDFLFDAGMADPRGGEYRQIELVLGNYQRGHGGVTKTHGWVLPAGSDEKQRFAVAWNGLVYPVASTGEKADLSADINAICNDPSQRFHPAGSEMDSISFEFRTPLKICLLLRLGNVDLAERYWDAMTKSNPRDKIRDQPDDAYLQLAREWCEYAFDRAVHAHMYGNDVVSRDTAKLLNDAIPKIEVRAKELGFKEPDAYGRNGKQLFINFVDQLPMLLADETRRIKEGHFDRVADDPKKFPGKTARITALIRDLELESSREWGPPGGAPAENELAVRALIREGDGAVEPLLDCLEHDDRLTRSVSLGHGFDSRYLYPVRADAYEALLAILQTDLFGPISGTADPKAMGQEMRVFWAKHRNESIPERWFALLADDKVGRDAWLDVASRIVEDVDVERNGDWRTVPQHKPGEIPRMKGEALRTKKNPSVTDLLIKRFNSLTVDETNRDTDIAIYLHQWDPPAAVEILRQKLRECTGVHGAAIDPQEKDLSSLRSPPTGEELARNIGRVTLALAESNDEVGTAIYRQWMHTQQPGVPENSAELVRPIWRFPNDRNLAAAAEELFNDEHSEWRCLPTNAHWSDFGMPNLLASPILALPAFGEHLSRNLDDLTEVGTAQVKDHCLNVKLNSSSGVSMGGVISVDPPLPHPPDATIPIRVCDWYAWGISKLDGAPAFELYWPVAKRDERRKKMMPFINRWRTRLRYTPLQSAIDRGLPEDDPCRMTFPKLDHPATAADVAATNAIFCLEGGWVRTVPLRTWPARAKWITNKEYPVQVQGETDSKTGVTKYIDAFNNEGLIWQAEEIQIDGKWKRYYGFVGAHAVIKVPAEEIEFRKE